MDDIFEVVGIRTLNFIGNDGRPVQKMQWFVTFVSRPQPPAGGFLYRGVV